MKPDQTSKENRSLSARLIAFYLPQFHLIPENDLWWGKGFTEWTNVASCKPLFPGHYQPHIPADLGFYDLRVPETRLAQAEMAKEHGIEGFCYWHYWFGNGRRLLERPFAEVLESGKPDFPFCLGWANETWAGLLHGSPGRVLIEQTYPGLADDQKHFYSLLSAFKDSRYIKVEGKPIFLVYKPNQLPDCKTFTDCWRKLAQQEGLPGIHFVGMADEKWNPNEHGFDASVLNEPKPTIDRIPRSASDSICRSLLKKEFNYVSGKLFGIPRTIPYKKVVKYGLPAKQFDFLNYPCVVPNWDTSPRLGEYGTVFSASTPELFGKYLNNALRLVANREPEQRLVFLKSWNEWAEGNYLEPDKKFGRRYLEVIRNAVVKTNLLNSPAAL